MKTIKNAVFAVILIAAIPLPVMAVDWEANITASTSTSAQNRISFGQRSDATDGFDGQYEVPAFSGGQISAYFPHPEWNVPAELYWRDIKGPDPQKTWVFKVESVLNGNTLSLMWNSSQIPEGYTAILVDDTTGASADMTTQGVYIYTNTGPRQFTINTEAPN